MDTTLEVCRLEFDDGTGKDFLTPEDALFEICYGKPPVGLRGVVHICAFSHKDATELVVDGEPVLSHDDAAHGDVIYTREQLQKLVDAIHADERTPALHGDPDKTTSASVRKVVKETTV